MNRETLIKANTINKCIETIKSGFDSISSAPINTSVYILLPADEKLLEAVKEVLYKRLGELEEELENL